MLRAESITLIISAKKKQITDTSNLPWSKIEREVNKSTETSIV